MDPDATDPFCLSFIESSGNQSKLVKEHTLHSSDKKVTQDMDGIG